MEDKTKKMHSYLYKSLIVIAVASLYYLLFSEIFEVYDSGWYVACATFLTAIYLRKKYQG